MKYTIFDLDNCISNDGWRIKHINWTFDDPAARYHNYHLLAPFDRPGNEDLWKHTLKGRPVIFTARPEFYGIATNEWLGRQGMEDALIFMRPNDDHSHSTELKRRQLISFFMLTDARPEDVLAAYDDREDVVEMYKEHDLNGQVARIHDICAYTNPIQRN